MRKQKRRMLLLTVFNFLIPKKKNALFFYDINGISMNEIAMIQYLLRNHLDQKLDIAIISNQPEQICRIIPKTFVYRNNRKGLWKQLRAKYIFLEQNSHEWSVYRAPGQKIIQLWHGLPIKKVGYLHNSSPLYAYDSVYSHVLAPSEYGWKIMKKCFRYADSKKIICSPPRCDLLKNTISAAQYKALGLDLNRKLILWMPTFRNNVTETERKYGCEFPLLSETEIQMLDDFLEENGMQIVIKPHSLQKQINALKRTYKHIFVFENYDLFMHGIDPYTLLGSAECLITDYSSTVYDYMLLDRPIIFTTDDLEDFKSVRGFIEEDYMSFFSGVCVDSYEGLTVELKKALAHIDQDVYDALRRKRNRRINQYHDFAFCERVFRKLGIIDK